MSDRSYKRSWKNLLINKQYQLRFTLFMVGLSTLLIAALGWWVMQTATEATNVAIGQVQGEPCPKIPDISEPSDTGGADRPTTPMKLPSDDPPPAAPAPAGAGSGSGSGSGSASGSGTGSGSADSDDDDLDAARRHRNVTVTLSSITETLPPDYAQVVAAHWSCTIEHAGKIGDLEHGKMLILYVLLATGTMLVAALAVYGLMTTHKVAGPLYKVSLYFAKMREGRYDKVWPLRKGDQLVAFYDHFRAAHAGIVKLEEDDIARLEAVIAAAPPAGQSPEVDAVIADLKAILERKEKSLA